MSYVIQAVLSNAGHPEYGQVTVPFPIPSEEYDRNIELLSALGIGDAVNRDCKVDGLDSYYTVLKRMVGTVVTVDELDYLAKRLDSFSFGEDAQFQAMAVKLGISNIIDFINLTFCCQQATVITDFSDLEQIGKNHYLTLNGGSASLEELEKINGRQIALALILNETGCVTPYGVVYDNGMELESLYNGRQFPEYSYDEHLLVIKVESDGLPDDQQNPEYLYLPAPYQQIERALLRTGNQQTGPMKELPLSVEIDNMPDGVTSALYWGDETLKELNQFCHAIGKLDQTEKKKLEAVILLARPSTTGDVCQLADNLDLFDFVPDVHTPEELGRYLIQESGRFDYDENLDDFYDYTGYGKCRIKEDSGCFNICGYVAYHGITPLDELMENSPASCGEFTMGGM